MSNFNKYPVPPKNYLTESIFATLFCCFPFGVIGILNASKVETLYNQALYAEAEQASKDAWKWCKYSFFGALIGWGVLVLAYLLIPLIIVLAMLVTTTLGGMSTS